MVDESGVIPKKYPPGLSNDDTFFNRLAAFSSLSKHDCGEIYFYNKITKNYKQRKNKKNIKNK